MNLADRNETRRIILARHGQTEWNKEFKFQGRTNVQLTEEGKRQAHSLASRLSSWPPEVIYTSPLDRAKYTASAIASRFNLEPVILPELEEINFGTWEGQSLIALENEHHEEYSRWRSDPFFNPPEGAEDWEHLSTRLSRAVKVMLDGPQRRIIAVSHGGIMRALYAVFLGLNPHKTWNIDVANCSMSGIEIHKGRPWLSFTNDNMHIRAGEYGEKLPVWGDMN
ncbi:MAG: histidine phosphatase family protein [Synergistaceae bacterium]|nr:histidine phosphatase family protein [Synergistaceae bacterium]